MTTDAITTDDQAEEFVSGLEGGKLVSECDNLNALSSHLRAE